MSAYIIQRKTGNAWNGEAYAATVSDADRKIAVKRKENPGKLFRAVPFKPSPFGAK